MPGTDEPRSILEQHRQGLPSTALADEVDLDRIGPYRGYRAMLDAILDAASRGARVEVLGHSIEGAPLAGLYVGPKEATEHTLVVAGIHAMEWIGIEVALALLAALVANPPTDRGILVVPALNVDGIRKAEANLRADRWRFVRTNARGVDLNRNWPTMYKSVNWPGLLLPFLGSAGSHPTSEPEVAAICQRLERTEAEGHRWTRVLSLHSVGPAILYPYGGCWKRPEVEATLRGLATEIAQQLAIRYKVTQVSRWVPGISFAHGMEIDHFLARHNALPLLVECSAGGMQLADPSSWLHPFRWFNPPQLGATVADLLPPLEQFVRGHAIG